jgi:hypothetical protein
LRKKDGWVVARPSLAGTWECAQRDRLGKRTAEFFPLRITLRLDGRVLLNNDSGESTYRPSQMRYLIKGNQLIFHVPEAPAVFPYTLRLDGDRLFLTATYAIEEMELIVKMGVEAEFRRVKE